MVQILFTLKVESHWEAGDKNENGSVASPKKVSICLKDYKTDPNIVHI